MGGGEYLKIVPYIPIFGFYLAVFSLLNVCVNFFLSLKKTRVSLLVVATAVLQIVLINLYHKDFFQIITISTVLSVILLMVLVLYFIKEFENLVKIKKIINLIVNPKNKLLTFYRDVRI